MNRIEIISAATNISAFVLILLIFMMVIIDGAPKNALQRHYTHLLQVALLGVLCEAPVVLLMETAAPQLFIRIFDTLSYAMEGVFQIAAAGYFYEYFRMKTNISRRYYRFWVGLGICAILLAIIAAFTGLYARFDANNQYIQQKTFWLSHLFTCIMMASMLHVISRDKKAYDRRELISLWFYSGVAMACYVLEVVYADLWVAQTGLAASLILLYINIQLQVRQEQQAELVEARIAIMLSQIQPHFLYNSLTAIDRLVYLNPGEAHEAIATFSDYLRVNMDALKQKTPILFEKELEHVRQYLYLEQLRFGTRLRIIYDIQAESFCLPVLTVQPIVENAVRYGVTKRPEGGTVTIRTEETPELVRITIADDGIGFAVDQRPEDARSHLGIANVRSRLADMCGGTLNIESSPGSGTTAMIEIPKQKEGTR